MGKLITIKLTPAQAQLVWNNADGWLDAGACKDGLTSAENRALHSLNDQISAQLHGAKKGAEAAFSEAMREQLLDAILAAGFAWHSDDERKILDAIMGVLADTPAAQRASKEDRDNG